MELLARAERPVFYVGGGVINPPTRLCPSSLLVRETGYPITLTLMGLGAYPASDPQFLGMLGMHGTYEANMAMHDCDVMVCIGARFDDRVTGRLDGFLAQEPQDPRRHRPVLDQQEHPRRRGDRRRCRARRWAPCWQPGSGARTASAATRSCPGGTRSADWSRADSLRFRQGRTGIKPTAVRRLYEATRDRDVYVTTDVGQHQMWAAQHFKFEQPLAG